MALWRSPTSIRRVAGHVMSLALVVTMLGILGSRPSVAGARTASIAQVRFILHGLGVRPPHRRAIKGKLKQSLYNQYLLTTRAKQKASVNFRDGTLLHINEFTDALLRSPSLTEVHRGEVEERVVPGTAHTVRTAAAVASAVGTIFDVRVKGSLTVVTVLEGAVLVQTPRGRVVVKSGQQVRILKGQAPSAPTPTDTGAVTRWTAPIPLPTTPLGMNIALDANGGGVYRWTSQRDDNNHTFDAQNAVDGRLDRGWQSADGQVTNQSLWLRFQGTQQYRLTGLFLDCAATGGQDGANAARDFEVLVADGDPGSGFQSVYTGSCAQTGGLQTFQFSAAVRAANLEITFKNNHGGSAGIAVAEVGVISVDVPVTLGTPTTTPTSVPTATPTPVPTAMPTPTSTVAPGVLAGSALDFGGVLFNQTSPQQTTTITNTGTGATTIQRIDIREQYQTIFNLLSDTCTGKTLPAGASCTLGVSFDPLGGASTDGALVVNYNGSSSPLTIPLTGKGFYVVMTIPDLQASWTSPLNEQNKNHLLTTNGTACASATRVGYDLLINDTNPFGLQGAHDTGSNVPLSQTIQGSGTAYKNPDGSLIGQADLFIQFTGVGTQVVLVKYTAAVQGNVPNFMILTPEVSPRTVEAESCPAGLQALGR